MIEISHPIKKERKLTTFEKMRINSWNHEKMAFIESYKELEAHLVEIEPEDDDQKREL